MDRLAPLDGQRLRAAAGEMQSRSGNRSHAYFAGIAAWPKMMAQHQNPLWLPWLRTACYFYEQALRDCGFESLPLWDFTLSATTGRLPSIFLADSSGDENPLASGALPELPPEAQSGGPADRTSRAPGSPGTYLPSAANVSAVLAIESFVDFTAQLEQLNNMTHVWVGGHMANVLTGAYDPLFWSLKAAIDEIWWLWQRRHPDAGLPPEVLGEVLDPFQMKVSDVLDAEALGYTYSEADTEYARETLYVSGAANDRPPKEDHLGFAAYASAFAEVIASPSTTPPLTIGIFGSWGAGKSTLLDEIEAKIRTSQGDPPKERSAARRRRQSPYVHIVRFNAWDYNADELIWPALARVTMEQIRKDLPGGRLSRFASLFGRNITREWRLHSGRIVVGALLVVAAAVIAAAALNFSAPAVAAGVLAVGLGGLLKQVNDTVNSQVSRWLGSLFQSESYGERVSYMEATKQDLEWLETRLLPEDDSEATADRRILVIIDDLDRCEPEKVVEALQAVNRLLDLKTFIVCLGVDARIVTSAIQKHYADVLEGAGASGFEYLDKIVQIPFRIPEPSDADLRRFMETQLPTQAVEDRREVKVIGPSEPGPAEDRPTTPAPTGPAAYELAPHDASLEAAPLGQRVAFKPEEAEAFRDMSPFLRPNPRHVKRLINVYRLVRSLAESRAREDQDPEARIVINNPQATIRWLVISAQWPYTAQAILAAGRRLETEGKEIRDPALQTLYRRVQPNLSDEKRNEFDDDPDRLTSLLDQTHMTWQQLRVIRRYTINFNPAVEHQLRLERARTRRRTSRPANGREQPTAASPTRRQQRATAGDGDPPAAKDG